MTVVGLHPEDLIDKAEQDQLTPSERIRLDTHVLGCSTCQVERAMRADFAEERAQAAPPPFSAEMLAAALGSARATQAPPPHRKPMRTWLLVAAALCTLATFAGAQRTHLLGAALESLAPSPQLLTPPLRTKPAPVSVPMPVFSAPVSVPMPVPSAVMAPPRETAATLFDEVVTARRARDYDRSIAACRALQSRYGASHEAQVSRGTLGRLLLDRGDAEGALVSFAEYQRRGGGELDEAVMAGRATAYERLGRDADARRAWLALLAAFPNTPYADQARARTGHDDP